MQNEQAIVVQLLDAIDEAATLPPRGTGIVRTFAGVDDKTGVPFCVAVTMGPVALELAAWLDERKAGGVMREQKPQ